MTLVSIRLFPVPTTAHQVCELEIASEDQDSGGGCGTHLPQQTSKISHRSEKGKLEESGQRRGSPMDIRQAWKLCVLG